MSATPPLPRDQQFTPTLHHDTYPYISPQQHQNLSGVSVLITGASRGIGAALAASYAAAGATHIAIAARSPPTSLVPTLLSAAAGAGRPAPTILPLAMDVTLRDSIEAAVKTVTEGFGGRLDVLVNNAGVLRSWHEIGESDPDAWWETMEVNVRGPYLVTRAFLPLLLGTEAGRKTVMNISSVAAVLNIPTGSAYLLSKFALLRFSEYLQTEYGDRGLLAMVCHPGGVETDLAKEMPQYMHRVLVDTPALAGDAIVWATAKRREWLAARYFSVTWDMEELERDKERIVREDLLKMKLAV